ncbi:MAG: prepilin-type N-terminal cleavage/methylation domain-containing protein, partial [Myxococcota bacterium]
AGLTLIEIMVVIAIIGIVVAVGAPALSGILALEQQRAISELAQTYIWLRDEASLRNVTFRVAYNLDQNTWKVEAGDPNTLVFSTPEEREANDREVQDRMDRYTERELEEGAEDLRGISTRFDGLDDPAFTTEQKLPRGIHFAFVYTPQYGEGGMTASEDPPDTPEEEAIAYTYIFPDGTAEHIVIRIVDDDDENYGYTLEIEPLTGAVRLTEDEIMDPSDSFSWIPDRGPSLR